MLGPPATIIPGAFGVIDSLSDLVFVPMLCSAPVTSRRRQMSQAVLLHLPPVRTSSTCARATLKPATRRIAISNMANSYASLNTGVLELLSHILLWSDLRGCLFRRLCGEQTVVQDPVQAYTASISAAGVLAVGVIVAWTSPAAVFHCAMPTGSPINVCLGYRCHLCTPQPVYFRIMFPARLSSQLSLHLILEVRPRDLRLINIDPDALRNDSECTRTFVSWGYAEFLVLRRSSPALAEQGRATCTVLALRRRQSTGFRDLASWPLIGALLPNGARALADCAAHTSAEGPQGLHTICEAPLQTV
ncbi:hypothetical protein C8Q79DRAFT_440304 [Trametes meyenii]|nr:hypothetical protein C8Q79DRAFT_440304 [Trametes meyenii]